MAHCHNLSVIGPRQHPQTIRQILFLHCQGMVSCHTDRRIDPGKYTASIMFNQRLLSMEQCLGIGNGSSQCLTDALMPQTDAKDRFFPVNSLTTSMQMPASFGFFGPGESTIRSGSIALISSMVILSFRTTLISELKIPIY